VTALCRCVVAALEQAAIRGYKDAAPQRFELVQTISIRRERDTYAQRKYGNAQEGHHKTKSEGGSQTGGENQEGEGGDT